MSSVVAVTQFKTFKPHWLSDSEWDGCIFNDKINFVKDRFYNERFPGDCCSVSMAGSEISMFGLSFVFDLDSETYTLKDKNYSSVDLICIADNFYRYFESINSYGFVSEESLNGNFISFFKDHLVTLGYGGRLLGNSEITYSMLHW
jgi:hypothetical protein